MISNYYKHNGISGGSPGPVVMGDDLCTRGRGFESQHRILDGHFSHIFVVKIVLFVCLKKTVATSRSFVVVV